MPQNSNSISTSPPSCISTRALRPLLTRTAGIGWIALAMCTGARHSDALSDTLVMAKSPGASATRRKLVVGDLALRSTPSKVYHTSKGGVPERVYEMRSPTQ